MTNEIINDSSVADPAIFSPTFNRGQALVDALKNFDPVFAENLQTQRVGMNNASVNEQEPFLE